MFESRISATICPAAMMIILLASGAVAQRPRKPAMNGAALAEAGRCNEAIPILKKEMPLIANPGLKRSAGLAGVRCAMEIGRFDDAVDFIRALTRDFPQDAEVLYQAVHVYSDLSLRSSQDLLINASSSYQLRLLNAEALETQERWDEAAAEYRAVLAQSPNLPGIHYRLGRLLLSLPENNLTPATRDDARREFEEELKINPRNAGAEYVLGEMARQAKAWAQASDHFANAARLNPAFADAHIGLGRSLISDSKYQDAIRPLEQAVKLQPENPVAHYHLATAYRRVGRTEEADRESVAFKQMSERAQQMKQDVQTGVLGPQKAEP
jgi:tetratricopeptide (TPR) repeat protein